MEILTNNFKLIISQDENPQSPREDDNIGTMVCFHRRYNLGDKHGYSSNDYSSFDELKKAIIKNENPAVILPIYMYDHSGITISTSSFGCQWDSGQIGFIFISKDKVKKEFNVNRINPNLKKRITEYLKGEVNTYDQYLKGEVYYFMVENKEGDLIDSCNDFYGDDYKTNGMLYYLPDELIKELPK